MTPCPHCKARNIYKFTDSLCCWVRFIRDQPAIRLEDGMNARDVWLNRLRKANKSYLADQIQQHIED